MRFMNNTSVMLVLISTVVFGACQNTQAESDDTTAALIETGKELAATLCSSCHAIGQETASPRMDAPPLRTVLARYSAEALGDDFREHIHVGHQDMPDFDFTVTETESLLAYLKSIQAPVQ